MSHVLYLLQRCGQLTDRSTTEEQHEFHLFFLEVVSVGRLLRRPLPKPVVPLSSSAPVSLPSVQGLDKKPWASILYTWRPSLLRADKLVWSKEPVLLHFLTSGCAREPGVSSEVSERLMSVSDKCSLFQVCRQPSDPDCGPTSSSDGSMESCRG